MSTSDGSTKSIGFNATAQWGHPDDETDGYTSLPFFKACSPDGRAVFCLRMAFNCGHLLNNPRTSEYTAFKHLVKESIFYSKGHLTNAQTVVPVHYGLWAMNLGEWGGKTVFSVTQWAGRSWGQLVRTEHNTLENRLAIGRAFEVLHDANVEHGQLLYSEDIKHILLDFSDDAPGGTPRCYFVDFSRAITHECNRTVPVVDHKVDTQGLDLGCMETGGILDLLKFSLFDSKKLWTSSSEIVRAMEWHKEYSMRHPEQPNRNILIAQRVKFYRTPTPYTNLIDFWFIDEDGRKLPETSISEDLFAKIVVSPRHTWLEKDLIDINAVENEDDDEEESEESSTTDSDQ